ncbi:MAG: cryptochrome/photolyase family protein, partial [Actinomycetota bacterium]
MKRILYIPFDHLHREHGVLKDADPKADAIVLVESERMCSGRPWHPERLFFLISSARHFAESLRSDGFTVEYIKAKTTIDGLKNAQKKLGAVPIYCAEPSSFRQYEELKKFGVTFHANDFFLTSRSLFSDWAKGQKSFLMENFYRKQRVRLNVLMNGTKPEG